MITYGKPETILPSGRHLGLMSTAVAALALAPTGCGTQWLPAGPAVGVGAPACLLWHATCERTT